MPRAHLQEVLLNECLDIQALLLVSTRSLSVEEEGRREGEEGRPGREREGKCGRKMVKRKTREREEREKEMSREKTIGSRGGQHQ